MSAPTQVTEAQKRLWVELYNLAHDDIFLSEPSDDKAHQLIADSEAKATAELRGALALGQQNCDDVYDDLRTERDQLRAEVEAQCLLNGKGAEREADLRGRLERAEREVERLKADGAASAFVNMSCRASRAETDRNNLRADLDAIKAIRDEEKARAARAEAELKAEQDNSAINEIELRFSRAIVSKIWVQLGSPTYEQLKGRSIYDLIDEMKAELTAERARLDWLVKSSDNPLAINLFPSYGWTEVKKTLRASIDAAMKEDAQ